MSKKRLRIAIQKSGRLSESSVQILRGCGIEFGNGLGKLRSSARNFPVEILFLRDDDIPQYVEDGVADAGIVGENVVLEKGFKVETALRLGFGRCRLSLAAPKQFAYEGTGDLEGLRIATSYPKILSGFLERHSIDAEIHTISGSVEIAPSIGLADIVCDLVSSGSTLFTNGLKEIETVLESEALLIRRSSLESDLEVLFEKLCFRIRAGIEAEKNKYVLLNAPNDKIGRIVDLLPGMRSPSVLPLAETGWSSVHSVIAEDDFWEVVENLRAEGAEGILVLSIDQMVI
ncbi:MAG: ATP phosphoribosyltransferase [Acidobacteria bacterium]|nr:MAG: ATP phosphoribosyltransferase [Acidobacteriota bacterium]REK03001.1 MAG: ATP phosphoribosyltransferase [Acidobacteriota bacterium]REK13195.1 MAG: ATP phosphoribosyltransferase [Acidobacteriota bacterium]REK41189.1 MAG: ATP phosphoribosyltransferase [Acidobacteriota bacterium]